MKLIDKSAVIAEIERKYNQEVQWMKRQGYNEYHQGLKDGYSDILSFLDALKVKEVDLEKALSDLDKDIKEFVTTEEFENESATAGHYWAIAKHAFLLGLKAQK